MTPSISVVIATRNRAASLRDRLARLLALSPGLAWELVVVDNGSSDETPSVLAHAAATGKLCALREPLPGKSRALNAALAVARGELIVFTDDDVDPHAAWLEELAAAAQRHPQADCFGGRIRAAEGTVPEWIAHSRNLQEILTCEHDYGEVEKPYPPNRFPIGPNMAVRRRVLERVPDPWPVDLGPGSSLPVGDERAFWLRLGLGGGRSRIYVPSAIVVHSPQPGSFGLPTVLRRCYRGGYSAAVVERRFPRAIEAQARGAGFAWTALRRTRSLRELACAGVRAFGYAIGRAS